MFFEKKEEEKERHRLMFGERGEEVDEVSISKDKETAINETISNIDLVTQEGSNTFRIGAFALKQTNRFGLPQRRQ